MVLIKDVNYLKKQIYWRGYNLASFSREIGVSRSYLTKIFKIGTISPKNAEKILVVLNKSFDEFFFIN